MRWWAKAFFVRLYVKRLPVKELKLNEVKVDRVKVSSEIHDLPNLNGTDPGSLRDFVHPPLVAERQHDWSVRPLNYIQESSPGVS